MSFFQKEFKTSKYVKVPRICITNWLQYLEKYLICCQRIQQEIQLEQYNFSMVISDYLKTIFTDVLMNFLTKLNNVQDNTKWGNPQITCRNGGSSLLLPPFFCFHLLPPFSFCCSPSHLSLPPMLISSLYLPHILEYCYWGS